MTRENKPVLIELNQGRVVEEKRELDEKLKKLQEFFANPIYAELSDAEQERLKRQKRYMSGYSNVLGERIQAFS